MRVFVTGGAGRIGRAVLARLSLDGHEVVALEHHTPLASMKGVTPVPLARPSVASFADAMRGCDAVCHAAGYVPADPRDPSVAARCLESNAALTAELCSASALAGVRRFVFLSGSNLYAWREAPPARESEPLSAEAAPFYFASKIAAESFVDHFRATAALDAVTLRVSSPYGGSAGKGVVETFVRRALAGQALEVRDPAYGADLVHVEDVARAVALAAAEGPGGTYNVSSGVRTTLLDLANTVCREIAPEVPVDAATPSSPRRGFRAADPGLAKSVWGWEARPLAAGVRDVARALSMS